MTWLLLAPLLVASTAAAQPQLPTRQRQDRRAVLPATASEPVLELYVAANNLTTAAFNAKLDPDSLVVDRTRFKWAEVSEHLLMLEPFADMGERLIVQVGFKDRALPAKAVIAVVSRPEVMDGRVEVDRRANTPEALLTALKQKDSELEELKSRYAGSRPAGLMLPEWLTKGSRSITLVVETTAGENHGLKVQHVAGYQGTFSSLIVVRLRNLQGQRPWELEQARITGTAGAPEEVLSMPLQQQRLEPGEEALVVLEAKTPPWAGGEAFSVTLIDTSGQRRFSINLTKK